MHLQEYKDVRKKLKEIHNNILDLISQDDMLQAAKLLGTLEHREIVLESPAEQDAHMDFVVYGEIFGETSKLEIYKEDHSEDHTLLEIMGKSRTSLYEVVDIDRENYTILLKDIIHPSDAVFNVVDKGMSETINKNVLIFTRLLHLEKFSMTSGMLFIFRRQHQAYLLRRSRKITKKLDQGNDSDKRFIAFFQLNRKDGIPTELEDVE